MASHRMHIDLCQGVERSWKTSSYQVRNVVGCGIVDGPQAK